MFIPNEPQPAATLITAALNEQRVYVSLRRLRDPDVVVAVNNCSDNRTIYNKIVEIKRRLKLKNDPVPVTCFGGLIRLSPYCPGYNANDAQFILNEFHTAVRARGVSIIYGGAHGELCGWCNEKGATVAQRHWLSCDAKRVILREAEVKQWSPQLVKVCVTWHRRHEHHGKEYQRTRVIGCRHPLFTEIPLRRVMSMTDHQMIERLAPHFLPLVAV